MNLGSEKPKREISCLFIWIYIFFYKGKESEKSVKMTIEI